MCIRDRLVVVGLATTGLQGQLKLTIPSGLDIMPLRFYAFHKLFDYSLKKVFLIINSDASQEPSQLLTSYSMHILVLFCVQ